MRPARRFSKAPTAGCPASACPPPGRRRAAWPATASGACASPPLMTATPSGTGSGRRPTVAPTGCTRPPRRGTSSTSSRFSAAAGWPSAPLPRLRRRALWPRGALPTRPHGGTVGAGERAAPRRLRGDDHRARVLRVGDRRQRIRGHRTAALQQRRADLSAGRPARSEPRQEPLRSRRRRRRRHHRRPHALVVSASSGATLLSCSGDGNRTWSSALALDSGGIPWSDLGFTTPADGVVIEGPAAVSSPARYSPGRVWLTEDGGRRWAPVRF